MNPVVCSELQRECYRDLEHQAEEAERSDLEMWESLMVVEFPEAWTVGGRLGRQVFLWSKGEMWEGRSISFAALLNMVLLDSGSPDIITNTAHLLPKVFLFGF